MKRIGNAAIELFIAIPLIAAVETVGWVTDRIRCAFPNKTGDEQ